MVTSHITSPKSIEAGDLVRWNVSHQHILLARQTLKAFVTVLLPFSQTIIYIKGLGSVMDSTAPRSMINLDTLLSLVSIK